MLSEANSKFSVKFFLVFDLYCITKFFLITLHKSRDVILVGSELSEFSPGAVP